MQLGNLSLRAKLLGALALVVTAASLPLIRIGYVDTYGHALEAAKGRFDDVTRIVADEVERSYLNRQTLVVEKATIEKDDIIAELDAVEEWVKENRVGAMRSTLDFLYTAWRTNVAVVNEWGEFLTLSPDVRRAWALDPVDSLGIRFREYLRNTGRNFARDEFTFLRLRSEAGVDEPYLVGVRKVAGYTVVVLQILDYLEPSEEALVEEVALHAKDAVASVTVDPRTTLRIVTASDREIARRGPRSSSRSNPESGVEPNASASTLSDALRRKARTEGFASCILDEPSGKRLAAVRYIKVLDWYVEGTVPLRVVSGPAERYAARLAGIAFGVFLIVALAGLGLVTWFLRPLRRLAYAAERLERIDLRSDDSMKELEAIGAGLPADVKDEVGLVARSFGRMLRALSKNVLALKESLARQHGIEGEMRAAREIQTGMLAAPDTIFRSEGFEAYGLTDPARDVGGDFYEVVELEKSRRALVVGDVSGKGASAALLMAVSLTLVRNALLDGLDPAAALKKVNDQIAARNPSCMFVTIWAGVFDPSTGRLDYANGGHCPPFTLTETRVGNGLEVRPGRLEGVSGPLVGALEGADYVGFSTTIAPGETVVLYTDGVSEAMNAKRELFGEERLEKVLIADVFPSTKDAALAVTAAVAAHRGDVEQSDDITMLVFRRTQSIEETAQ